jgi:hypothetical protein
LLPKQEKYNYNEFINLFTINKFMEFIQGTSVVCPISSLCSKKPKTLINDNCYNLFENINYSQNCDFIDFLKRYKLNEVKWETNTDGGNVCQNGRTNAAN